MKHAALRVRTGEPDYSDVEGREYDWARSVYGNVTELIPEGKNHSASEWLLLVDANLMHDLLTGDRLQELYTSLTRLLTTGSHVAAHS
jgi:hypothetical protein